MVHGGLQHKKINLGLDLQGGLHLVYSIDLNKAIDDKASDIKRDLESKFIDDKVKATVKTPLDVLGGITVIAPDAASRTRSPTTCKPTTKTTSRRALRARRRCQRRVRARVVVIRRQHQGRRAA